MTADKPSKKPAKGKAPAAAAKEPAKPRAKEPAKPRAKEPAKPRASRQRAPTHAAIAKRAYELSLADGGAGDELSHWLQAERELTQS